MGSRRLFLGSVAAAGVGAFGVTAIDFPVAAQPAADPVTGEILRQIRGGLQQLIDGNGANGARQLATTLRIYAATVNDDRLRAVLRKTNRQTLLYGAINHTEMQRVADELGIPKSLQPPHPTTTTLGREQALERLMKGGLSGLIRQVADALDRGAVNLQERATQVRNVSRQCRDCNWACDLVQPSLDAMTVICAAALLFPPVMEVCMAATANYLTVWLACNMCAAFSFC